MWLPRGPVLEPLEDALIALDDPVLVDGGLLHLRSCDGHAKAHLQHPAPWADREPTPYTLGGAGEATWRRGRGGRALAERNDCY